MENGLAIIGEIRPVDYFSAGGSKSYLESIKTQVLAQASKLDISTAKGRDAIASLAYQVARTATGIDDLGKELVEGWKTQAKVVDVERKYSREYLGALKVEVRKELTDWENADKLRVAALEAKVALIGEVGLLPYGATIADIETRIAALDAIDLSNMQEFTSRSELAEKEVRKVLVGALAEAQRRDAEAAEMARLRKEAAEREQKERDERIAKEAREKAQREAEEERHRVEQEKFAAEARAKQAEAARIESERLAEERRVAAEARAKQEAEEAAKRHAEALAQAEERRNQEAKAAEERAERERLAAVEAERERVAAEARKVAAETEARERDKKHKSAVMGAAKDALIAAGIPEEHAKAAVLAIQRGQVPAVRIEF
jgi:colicin import membrane protein